MFFGILKSNVNLSKHKQPKSLYWRFLMGYALSCLAIACTNNSTSRTESTTGSPGSTTVIRIGYQRFTDLDVLRTRKNLDQRLQAEGDSVEWTLFQAGPPLMEAINAGSIDIGGVGEVPPIFAQAGGAQVVYVSTKPAAPDTYAILVPRDSSITSLAELKGRRVALVRGSSAQYLLVQALKSVGLQFSDIQPTFLSPADARLAFDQKKIDAWVIWDPFLTVAQQSAGARVLASGQGLGENRGFHLASRTFAQAHPDLIKVVQEELAESEEWAKNNPEAIAKEYASQLGLDEATLETVARRRSYGVLPINDAVLAQQQAIADTFFELNLIPKQIDVKQVTWTPN